MKIEKCSPALKNEALLDYEEIIKEEGIYKLESASGHVVVLRLHGNEDAVAFFVSNYGSAEPCSGVRYSKYKKSAARLCLEIRE